MMNCRIYGQTPFTVAVIHGGPGAPGSMAPVARELAKFRGVVEPLQTADSVQGQVEELRTVLDENADLPVTLIGHSWGAWLAFIFSATFPVMVRKLILVGSGTFEAHYASGILETRLARLPKAERDIAVDLLEALGNSESHETDGILARLGGLINKADHFDPLPHEDEVIEVQDHIFRKVWPEADDMRRSGKLLNLGARILCPVTAIHGDYDPHPAEGVAKPLKKILRDFSFILLEKCGHEPWIERAARQRFFDILNAEILKQTSAVDI